MPRLLPTVLVVALLAGTAAAFAVTETLKLKPAPIAGTQVDKVFSPVCACPQQVAHVRFRLVRKAVLHLSIVRDGRVVRTLVRGKLFGRGPKHFEWNGRDDAGRVVPDGSYDPRVDVSGRTIQLPNPIVVDTVPPRLQVLHVAYGRSIVVRYRVSEHAHGLLFLGGRRVVYTRFQPLAGTIRYRPPRRVAGPFSLAAQDRAGNVSPRVPVRLPL